MIIRGIATHLRLPHPQFLLIPCPTTVTTMAAAVDHSLLFPNLPQYIVSATVDQSVFERVHLVLILVAIVWVVAYAAACFSSGESAPARDGFLSLLQPGHRTSIAKATSGSQLQVPPRPLTPQSPWTRRPSQCNSSSRLLSKHLLLLGIYAPCNTTTCVDVTICVVRSSIVLALLFASVEGRQDDVMVVVVPDLVFQVLMPSQRYHPITPQ
jgi:hypothetical protein